MGLIFVKLRSFHSLNEILVNVNEAYTTVWWPIPIHFSSQVPLVTGLRLLIQDSIWLLSTWNVASLNWDTHWVWKQYKKECKPCMLIFLNVYFFWGRWGIEREGVRENPKQTLCWQHMGLEPTNHEIMTWAETKSQTLNWLSHPGTPLDFLKYWSHVKIFGEFWLNEIYY